MATFFSGLAAVNLAYTNKARVEAQSAADMTEADHDAAVPDFQGFGEVVGSLTLKDY